MCIRDSYILAQSKFTASQGHGFAAEVGNNFIDNVKGTNAEVIGNNNAKNGADRYILNRDGTSILIQDKYYKDAKSGIDACFETNEAGEKVFRYVDADGNPMIIEVPKDQYDDAEMCIRDRSSSFRSQRPALPAFCE